MTPGALIAAGALPTDDRVRALAEEVLARREYAEFRADPTELQELVSRLADWLEANLGWLPDRIDENWQYIWEMLLALFEGIFVDHPVGLLLRFVLGAAVVGAAIGIVVAIVRALRGRLADDAESAEGRGAASSAGRLITSAEALADEGRFLEAAHAMQLATLELLLRREWVALERSDPNRTLRRRIDDGRLPSAERVEFLALLDRLESRWFRDRTEDLELYGAWRGLHARLDGMAVSG